ncbi:MAG TPA: DUF1206 domain-containing protein [Longimicrobium sp.]|nr:DUF1206 domain-containing protein [Longimicrobium sp.]
MSGLRTGGAVDEAGRMARGAARDAAPWVERLARAGYAAKGIVYVVVGGIAAQAALGRRSDVQDSRGAFSEIIRHPGGKFLLGIIAVGLVGYAVWRFVQAALDPEGKGDAKSYAKRVGYAGSGIIHAGLALSAARVALGSSGGGGGAGAQSYTARLMDAPGGRFLVAAVALGLAAYGIYQLFKAYRTKLGKRLDLSSVSAGTREWIVRAGRAGLAARGVIFTIVGFFLIRAALQRDPGEARGLEGALEAVRAQSYGPLLLGLMALGLIGYGVLEMVNARYRRIQPA